MLRKIVAIASLLITLAVGFSWVRSWFSVDAVMIGDNNNWRMAWHGGGRVNVTTGFNRGLPLDFRLGGRFEPLVDGGDIHTSTFPVKGMLHAGCDIFPYDHTNGPSFDYQFTANSTGASSLTTVTFPYWIPFVILALYPSIVFIAWLMRRSRSRQGRCIECGYDLRGTVAAGINACPECGVVVPTGTMELAS